MTPAAMRAGRTTALALGLLAFVLVLRVLRAEAVARNIVSTAQQSIQVITNPKDRVRGDSCLGPSRPPHYL